MRNEPGLEARVFSTTLDLERYITANNYAGFDPYDVKGTRLFMWALALPRKPFIRNVQRKVILAPLVLGERYFPRLFRWLLRVRPTINAKGVSLIAKAYFNLFLLTGEVVWKVKAVRALDWLVENRSAGYEFHCWGYPFNWDSGVVVPASTPASVVSAAAFDAFWQAWRITQERRYLDVCESICQFFCKNLNITRIDADTVCFSYTPRDHFQVHNTNLLVADCLLRCGKEIGNRAFVDYGVQAANFALKEQNVDGSIFYWSRSQDHMLPGAIDHYHSGFEMRCLYSIWKTTGEDRYKIALDRYYAFYRKYLVAFDGENPFPNMYPGRRYPINVHSCAEGILLNATLCEHYEDSLALMTSMTPAIIDKMRTKQGWFKYMVYKAGPLEIHSNISFMRWSQAWMFLALSQALLACQGRIGRDG